MGQSPASSSYNDEEIGLPFFQGNADFGDIHPTARTWCNAPKKIAEAGDILLSVRAPVGALNIANETCCIGRGLAAIRPNRKIIDPRYLMICLHSNRKYLDSVSTGSTFKAISKKTLLSCELPLCTLAKQEAIVVKFRSIAQQEQQARLIAEKLDDLVKSQFVEMFGDGKLPLKTIGELATDIRYGTSKKASESGRYTYLRMNNITDDGKLNYSDVKRIDLNDDELAKCQVIAGDLLFNRTNSREKVGKTAVFHEETPMIIAGYIIRVRLCPEIFPDYLSTYMNLPTTKKMLRSIAKGAVHQANINSKELAAIEVPVAPIALQEQFLNFIARVDKLGFDVRQQIGNCARLNIDSAHYFDSFAVWRASLLH